MSEKLPIFPTVDALDINWLAFFSQDRPELDERFLQIGVKESQVDGIPIYLGISLSLLIGLELTVAVVSANKHDRAKCQLKLEFVAGDKFQLS